MPPHVHMMRWWGSTGYSRCFGVFVIDRQVMKHAATANCFAWWGCTHQTHFFSVHLFKISLALLAKRTWINSVRRGLPGLSRSTSLLGAWLPFKSQSPRFWIWHCPLLSAFWLSPPARLDRFSLPMGAVCQAPAPTWRETLKRPIRQPARLILLWRFSVKESWLMVLDGVGLNQNFFSSGAVHTATHNASIQDL